MFKKIFNSVFGSHEDIKAERELREMTMENFIRDFDVEKVKNNKMEKKMETNEVLEQSNVEVSANVEIKNEEEKVEIQEAEVQEVQETEEKVEEVEQEEQPTEETKIEDVAEEVSEDTDVVEEQPKNETEEKEPTEEETVETQEEKEEEQEQQEEPQEKVEEEAVVEQTVEEKVVEVQEEIKEVEAPQNSALSTNEAVEVKSVIKETSTSNSSVSATNEELLAQIEALKAENAKKEIALAKAELSKTIELDYAGVPGKVEEKTDMVYEIQNSTLSENAKSFILNSLKSLSEQNLKDCQEVGFDADKVVEEKDETDSKVKLAMKEHGLTENQAFLYVNGDRSLTEAKKASKKVQSKK